MTDKELLELAARAAGYIFESWTGGVMWVYAGGSKPDVNGEYPIFLWNPLTDDGDALRLAVKLNLLNNHWLPRGELWRIDYFASGGDKYATTRRAIVRAAAKIGKDIP